MTGDQQDILYRLKQVLPLRWFPDDTPVLDTLLSGIATAWSQIYGLLQEVKDLARLSTAGGAWLDLIAADYFGSALARRIGEGDSGYQLRIKSELIRDRGTRAAVVAAVTDITTRAPLIFEPGNTGDTGGYGGHAQGGGLGYGVAGGWGSLELPMQFFITAFRPEGVGIASVSGWGAAAGGYGQAGLEYASLSMMQDQITDAAICAAIANVLPVNVIAWTRITS